MIDKNDFLDNFGRFLIETCVYFTSYVQAGESAVKIEKEIAKLESRLKK